MRSDDSAAVSRAAYRALEDIIQAEQKSLVDLYSIRLQALDGDFAAVENEDPSASSDEGPDPREEIQKRMAFLGAVQFRVLNHSLRTAGGRSIHAYPDAESGFVGSDGVRTDLNIFLLDLGFAKLSRAHRVDALRLLIDPARAGKLDTIDLILATRERLDRR